MASKRSKGLDCNKVVIDKDDGIQCESCEEWFHSKCQKLSDDVYDAVAKYDSLHWYCVQCN